MRRWLRLAIANWWASPGRTCAVVLSVALGVATVTIITNFYETARRAVSDEVVRPLLGAAHVTVYPVGAHWASLDATLADDFSELDNVEHVTTRLRRRSRLVPIGDADRLLESTWQNVDAIGVTPSTEQHFLTLPNLDGRMLQTGERGGAVLERATAGVWDLAVGDDILLTPYYGGPKTRLTITGLFDTQRLADFQQPSVYVPLEDLQELRNEPGVVTSIELMLHHPSSEAIEAAKTAVEAVIAKRNLPYPSRVYTAAGRQLVLDEAERITRMLLMLIAFVAMLTSFFIILTTQGVSLLQRRPQLGIMRCVGLTRGQLTALLAIELIPLGVIGTILGILAGIGQTYLVAALSDHMSVQVHLSTWGLKLAAGSGLITILLGTLLLILQVGHVAPLEAVNAQARATRLRFVYLAGAVGVALLVLHQCMTNTPDRTQWLGGAFAGIGAGSLHVGYVLLAPVAVVLLGRPIARFVGRLLGLSPKLAEDPFVRGPWRTTGACWVLMIGLSLIVYIAIRAEGVLAIWDFPARLPSAFVWTPDYVPGKMVERVRTMPGVGPMTISTDLACKISTAGPPSRSVRDSLIEAFLKRLTRPVFVAGDSEELLGMMKIVFIEGTRDEAVEKLRQGGYVLIPPPTSRNHNLHVGDQVTVTILNREAEFEVAGVIQSPALDLAVTAFEAHSYMQIASASAILGTRADLMDKFGIDDVSMFMFDADLPPMEVPPTFALDQLPNPSNDAAVAQAITAWQPYLPNEREVFERIGPALAAFLQSGDTVTPPSELRDELRRFAKAIQRVRRSVRAQRQTAEQNWEWFRERLVLERVAATMERPNVIKGSLRRMKRQIDEHLRRAIVLITWLPSIMLVVAGIGIANLMMVSVHQRARQIAVLRAVGAQKSQIVRSVVVEAATIGLLGSVMGLALGMHEAHSVNRIASDLIDVTLEFIVPVGTVALSIGLTVAVCLVSGIGPARRAARNNIISALHTT